LLYGWLNDNFRKEFHKIGTSFIAKRRNQTGARDMTDSKPPGEMLTSVNKKLDVSVIVEIRNAAHHHQEQQLGVPSLIVCGNPQTSRPAAGSGVLAVPSTINYPMKEMSTAESSVTQLTSS
jgi:hypothetical protein